MKKIISLEEVDETVEKLHASNKTIALAGGCFDILHAGHIKYLEEAKKNSDILIVLLESDENIKRIKDDKRPINNQKNRSIVLSAISAVDYIIQLEGMTNGPKYDKLIVQIKPAYIVITAGDKFAAQRQKQCELVNAKLVQVKKLEDFSSSKYIKGI